MKNLKDRLARLEQEAAARLRSTQCDTCRDWPFVCMQRIDVDGSVTWDTEEPRQCPNCGWTAVVVVFHIVADWRSVSPPSRGR
jgi:hypothetical protein